MAGEEVSGGPGRLRVREREGDGERKANVLSLRIKILFHIHESRMMPSMPVVHVLKSSQQHRRLFEKYIFFYTI